MGGKKSEKYNNEQKWRVRRPQGWGADISGAHV
jgi:hypothetical protein